MSTIIRRHQPPAPPIEPELLADDADVIDPAPSPWSDHAASQPWLDAASDVDAADSAAAAEPVPPLFQIMAALPQSGASTLAAWCGCAAEVERDTRWRPAPGRSPYLVLTAPKTPDGVRAARQLAGALSRTVGGGAQVAAIALLEDQPRPTLALRELINAAERAGIPIHTLSHDPRMRLPDDTEQQRRWTPQNAAEIAVPPVLEHIYRHVFHHIALQEN